MSKIPVLLCWSGGKDCSYALYQLMQDDRYEVISLISTINGNYRRLSIHGVREELIDAQAKSIGIPLRKVYVYKGNNEEYEQQMNQAFTEFRQKGVGVVAFGDIFLEDVRSYREETLKAIGMSAIFPIWKTDTRILVQDFIDKGFISHTCCITDGYLSKQWVGRKIDKEFIEELPQTVDPCGENGEFHTFCSNGPIFNEPIGFSMGELEYWLFEQPLEHNATVLTEKKIKGFWFCDLLPDNED
ncbi:MAG: diphthine--ammonia ligase [Chitinophagaceae bacterium]|nr:diphthine--ammonia ligase [Chitinophagaceae bacterium]